MPPYVQPKLENPEIGRVAGVSEISSHEFYIIRSAPAAVSEQADSAPETMCGRGLRHQNALRVIVQPDDASR